MSKIGFGMSEKSLNTEIGMDLTGFVARRGPSEGKHDDLKVKCMAFDDGASKLVIVVCDLLGLGPQYTHETKLMISEAVNVAVDNIILACTHTHSGPASMILWGCGNAVQGWLDELKLLIVECAVMACNAVQASELSYSVGECDINFNRVLNDYTGNHTDRQVCTLKIRNAATGSTEAILVNYGCHAVVLGAGNRLYTRDYPYYMEEALKMALGAGVQVMFTNCCCGDQNPVERGTYEIAEKLGTRLAESVVISGTVLTEECFYDARIRVQGFDIDIPLDYEHSVQYFETLLDGYSTAYIDEQSKNKNSLETKIQYTFIQWASDMLSKLKNNTLDKSIKIRVVKAQIGRLTLVALPFEVFHSIGLRIKKHFGDDTTIVMGYANGNYGYLPSNELYGRAAYEAGDAFRYYGYPGPVVKEAEDIICGKIFQVK